MVNAVERGKYTECAAQLAKVLVAGEWFSLVTVADGKIAGLPKAVSWSTKSSQLVYQKPSAGLPKAVSWSTKSSTGHVELYLQLCKQAEG